ncbi:hypothetical protein J31TS6_22150 [Brevibacillus reuszeri]|uniref:hypothetical protein n=1 Tax=Brevibacillus reuszeri TaxID=54915 RepID=UPI001B2EE20F|nr:hypothetical protein [Brevibacillus reuszeri]GIO06187.1 hypothetical protein J31TS6_22150 [Brevibacillus reuszeri]
MKRYLSVLRNVLLTFCLLFTFIFTSPVTALSREQSTTINADIEIEVPENDEVFFELLARNDHENSTYSIKIIEQDDHYLWMSQITLDGKEVSATEFTINEIKDSFDPKELERQLTKTLQGTTDSKDLEDYLNEVFDIASEEESDKSNRNEKASALAVPLLVVPLAAGVISSSTIAALETALFATLTAATATVATAILEERHRSSNATAEVRTRNTYPENWSDFTGIPSATSTTATKHIALEGVEEISDRIKRDRNNDGDLEIYVSTTDIKESVLVVYDINSSLNTTVNRHLGNKLDRSELSDPSYRNETLNLRGYTVFLIFSYRYDRLFHVHFVPQADRTKELKYMRYNGNFDLQIFDRVRFTPGFNENLQRTDSDRLDYERKYNQAKRDRNLTRDSNGRKSVVPYR